MQDVDKRYRRLDGSIYLSFELAVLYLYNLLPCGMNTILNAIMFKLHLYLTQFN